jgi:hypothetical protein
MRVLANRFKTEETPVLREMDRMHGRLEQYLVEAGAGLKSLRTAERDAELLELRSHLGALMEAEQELGATPEEAAKNALKQFGSARDVTDQIVKVHQSPKRQFVGALFVSVLGSVMGYSLAQVLEWTRSIENGRAVIHTGLSTLSYVLVPLVLGTVVGKVFPRALRARVPLAVAAFTWMVTTLWAFMAGINLDKLWEDVVLGTGYCSTILLSVLSNPWVLLSLTQSVLVFLTLAWAAQSVARRPARKGGFLAWGKDLLSRIPDTWVGGIAIQALAFAGVTLVNLPFTVARMFQNLSFDDITRPSPGMTLWGLFLSVASGWFVGCTLPRRGWIGPMLNVCVWPIYIGAMVLASHQGNEIWSRPEVLTTQIFQMGNALMGLLTAYFVGRSRIKKEIA